MKRFNFNVLIAPVLATILLAAACTRCSTYRPLPDAKCKYVDKIHSNTHLESCPEATSGKIYLDLSVSMQGYISPPDKSMPFTLLQHILHNILQTSFHHVGISKLQFAGFSDKIEKNSPPMNAFAVSIGGQSPRSRFNRSQTNIIAILREIPKENNSLNVIITDGLQDVCSINGKLAPGFDRPEFIQAICKGLVDKEFGIWLIGIMNDFNGYYYNIIPNRNGEINKPIYIKGKRPVYCWVISRDINKGREFVSYMHKNIKSLADSHSPRSGHEKNLVQSLELSPIKIPDIELPKTNSKDFYEFRKEDLRKIRDITSWGKHRDHPEEKTIRACRAVLPKDASESIPFVIRAKFHFDNPQNCWDSLPPNIWQINSRIEGKFNLDPIEKPISKKDEDFSNSRFNYYEFSHQRLITMKPQDLKFEIPIFLHADIENNLQNHWTKRWSTDIDTTAERVNGNTLYLYDIVSAILKHSVSKEKIVGCLHLTFREGR